jgi:hypothetical protein
MPKGKPSALHPSNPLDWVQRQDNRMDELNYLIACGLGDRVPGEQPVLRSYRANWDAFDLAAAMARITRRPRKFIGKRNGHAHP